MNARTLLFTDVVDSTKHVQRLGDAAAAALWAEHDRVARELLARHAGLEIDRSDGFFVLFDDVAAAARFAMEYHAALAPLGISARVGIHHGWVTLRPNPPDAVARGAKPLEAEGLAKPLAARVMGLAASGQTLLSGDAAAALQSHLAVGLELHAHGHYRLKGIEDPLPLFQIGGERSGFVPPADVDKAYRVVRDGDLWRPVREIRHNLAPERDTFVGRTAELRQLSETLEAGARLISVLGFGGIGKTRLVRRYARAWLGDWPGGVFFCDLSEARSIDGICFALASALEVPLGKDDPVVQLGHAIAGRGRCLVLLDNFEQVVQHATATIGHWLDRAVDAAFVVTSRERLQLAGENALLLEPLPTDADAIDLFAIRARAQRPGFELDESTRDPVLQVVKLLDGLPLAIELAAARVRVLSPAQILNRLRDRFELLAGARGAASRQATLRAAIDWSWELLAPWEQAALAQCSVFEGGFRFDAAEAVIDLTAWPQAPPLIDVVQSLVDKSLLRSWILASAARLSSAEPHFGMYLSIHEYAATKLRAQDATATRLAIGRHGVYFAGFGTDAAVEALQMHGGVGRHRALFNEIDNLVAACRRAISVNDPAIAVGTFRAAWQVIELRGPFSLALALGEQVLAIEGLGARQSAVALVVRAEAMWRGGLPGAATAGLEQALAMAREVGDERLQAAALSCLGHIDREAGRLDQAKTHYRAALTIAEATDHRRGQGSVLNWIGNLLADQALMQDADAHYKAALAIHREVGNRSGEGASLGSLGVLRWHQGHNVEAHASFEAALAIHREVGNRNAEGGALSNIGVVHRTMGHIDEALSNYRRALDIVRDVGNRRSEAQILGNIANLVLEEGRTDEASAQYEAALAIARNVGPKGFEGRLLLCLGNVYREQGRAEDAHQHFLHALAIERAVGDRLYQGSVLTSLADLLLAQGRLEEASGALREAEPLLRSVGNGVELALMLSVRGHLELTAAGAIAARATLAEVETLAQTLNAGPGSAVAGRINKLREAVN